MEVVNTFAATRLVLTSANALQDISCLAIARRVKVGASSSCLNHIFMVMYMTFIQPSYTV